MKTWDDTSVEIETQMRGFTNTATIEEAIRVLTDNGETSVAESATVAYEHMTELLAQDTYVDDDGELQYEEPSFSEGELAQWIEENL